MTNSKVPRFRTPSKFEHVFNRLVAFLAGIGVSFPDGYKMLVAGRKSGRIYTVMVTVPEIEGVKYLVAPRGETQWVRNVRAQASLTLIRGSREQRFKATEIHEALKCEVLAEYLGRYRKAVQRYFPLDAGAKAEAFQAHVAYYPVFTLTPID